MMRRKTLNFIIFIVVFFECNGICSVKQKYDPTTFVFPPYLHTYGIRKATKYHLFLFMQNRVKFRDPQDLAVVRLNSWDDPSTKNDDDEVTVYGVNSGQNNILYNTSMTTLGVYGIREKEEYRLNSPHGIDANAYGDVYIADTGNNRIIRLFNEGRQLKYVCSIGQENDELQQPYDVTLDSQGNLYVVDTGHHRIVVFDKHNQFLYTFGGYGKEKGKFSLPKAIAVNDRFEKWSYYHDEFIIVIDSNGTRIQKFLKRGGFVKAVDIGEFGFKNSELMYMAVDYYSNIYITDMGNHCIHKFDRNLNHLTSYGRKGKGDKEFTEPRGITIYRRFGQIFIAEKQSAQYYWIGIDYRDFSVSSGEGEHYLLYISYFLTDPSFVTVDVLDNDDMFVTRIWNKRFKISGDQHDVWNGLVKNWPDSLLIRDNISLSEKYKDLKMVPKGKYKIQYKFEPTYSSYKYFSKKVVRPFEIK